MSAPVPPPPHGVDVRPARPEDSAAVATMLIAAEMAVDDEPQTTVEDLDADWAQPSMDLGRDTVVAKRGEVIVGYADHSRGRGYTRTHPDEDSAHGEALGDWLLGWAERAARDAGMSNVGETINNADTVMIERMRRHGYTPEWDSWVFRYDLDVAPPGPDVPDGYEIDPMQPGEERMAHRIIEDAFNEWDNRQPTDFEDWFASMVDRPDVSREDGVLMAWHGDTPVGAALTMGFDDGTIKEGWIQQLAVVKAYRGRGVARALLHTSFERSHAHGFDYAGLNTDSRTGAKELYLGIGMRIHQNYTRWSKELT